MLPTESIKQRREAGPSPDEFASNTSALGLATDVSIAGTDASRQRTCERGLYGFSSNLLTFFPDQEGAVEEHNSWEGTWSHDVPVQSPESGGSAPEQETLYETAIDGIQLGAGVKSSGTAHILDSLSVGQSWSQQPSSLRSASENVSPADILTPEGLLHSLQSSLK